MGKTIVFVHGAWLTSLSWENLIGYFEDKGYTCLAPEWPYRDDTIENLRANTPAELSEIGVTELVDHYASIVGALPEPPILIGHSFGGIIVQQLADRGLGSAVVALDSVAPEGVFALDWSVLKANTGTLLNWMGWNKIVYMTLEDFAYAFANGQPEEQQKAWYERYVVPETGRVFFQAAFAQLDPHHAMRVNFHNNDRAPLLLIAGEIDHLIPAHVTKSNYEHYKNSLARTDFHEFPGRAHLLVAQDGWEEVAAYIENWLGQVAVAPVGAAATTS